MPSKRTLLIIAGVIAAAALIYFVAIPRYNQYQTDLREQSEVDNFTSAWDFDPNDPKLLEVRFLATDGYASVSFGLPTITERDGQQFLDFVPHQATFLDLGAKQIHMASKPDATLADIPLGSTVKIRFGYDGTNEGNYIIYDILVVE